MNLARLGRNPFASGEGSNRHTVSGPLPVRPVRKGNIIRISDFCFTFAALSALTGMGLGLYMGIAQDFVLSPAHAHLNLLGWVTMAIYGLYHRGTGRTGGLLGWLQAGSGAFGAASMAAGLAHYLATGSEALFLLALGGAFLVVLSMLLFVGLVLVDARRRALPFAGAAVQSG
jgi:hypothetical protein